MDHIEQVVLKTFGANFKRPICPLEPQSVVAESKGTCWMAQRKSCDKRASPVLFFAKGICICYTLHVCKYKDASGRLSDPIGGSGISLQGDRSGVRFRVATLIIPVPMWVTAAAMTTRCKLLYMAHESRDGWDYSFWTADQSCTRCVYVSSRFSAEPNVQLHPTFRYTQLSLHIPIMSVPVQLQDALRATDESESHTHNFLNKAEDGQDTFVGCHI